MTEKELQDNNYIQQPIGRILCQSCCDILNFTAITAFPSDSRLQFLFCSLVVTHIIHMTRKKVQTPKWVPDDMFREFVVLEIYKDIEANGQLCFQHLIKERGFIQVFDNCLTWARNWSSCPYKIEEDLVDKSFSINVYHDKRDKENGIGSVHGRLEEDEIRKKTLH